MYLVVGLLTAWLFYLAGQQDHLALDAMGREDVSGTIYHSISMVADVMIIVGLWVILGVHELIKLNEKESKPLEQRKSGIDS